MKKSVKWVAATAAVMLTLSATAGMTISADEGTTVKAGFIFLHLFFIFFYDIIVPQP